VWAVVAPVTEHTFQLGAPPESQKGFTTLPPPLQVRESEGARLPDLQEQAVIVEPTLQSTKPAVAPEPVALQYAVKGTTPINSGV